MLEVEAAKHLREKMTDQQRGALVKTIAEMPWSPEEIRARAMIVKKTDTYGSIGFDKWFNAKPVYSEGEAYEMATRIIERRKNEFKRIQLRSEDELAKEGLIDVQSYHAFLIAGQLADTERKILEEVQGYRTRVKALPTDKKRILKALLYEKRNQDPAPELQEMFSLLRKIDLFWASHESISAITDDDFWEMSLHYFIPWMLPEVREMCK